MKAARNGEHAIDTGKRADSVSRGGSRVCERRREAAQRSI
jgi:hypothetical protein